MERYVANFKKVVAVVPLRNVASKVKLFLATLAPIVDAIVILDDASTDSTADVIRSVASSFKVHARHLSTEPLRRFRWRY